MGVKTLIAWCHCTFNLWWGCVEVSPACDNCYARILARRYGHDVWGKAAPHRFFGDKHWDELWLWNRRYERAGTRGRVFVMSMGDWGEERDDAVGEEMERCRQRLWSMIPELPALDLLMLTKRPQAYRRLVPASILALPNVWRGVTVESPEYLWRAERLLEVNGAGPAWVSYEPVLAQVDFDPVLYPRCEGCGELKIGYDGEWSCRRPGCSGEAWTKKGRRLEWLVVGCESRGAYVGRNADGYEACARSAITQGAGAGIYVFHKQMPVGRRVSHDPAEWPTDLRMQNSPR